MRRIHLARRFTGENFEKAVAENCRSASWTTKLNTDSRPSQNDHDFGVLAGLAIDFYRAA
jgi:hypothetical protein